MLFDLDDDTKLLQRTVREFAQGEIVPAAEELDRTKSFPYELVAKMGELGWMGIPFPEEVGGAGGTSLQYAIAVEELTRADSSVAITMCAHTSLGTQPVYLFGSEEQKARLMPDLCAGPSPRSGAGQAAPWPAAGCLRPWARPPGSPWPPPSGRRC